MVISKACTTLRVGIWREQVEPQLSPLVKQTILKDSKLNWEAVMSV